MSTSLLAGLQPLRDGIVVKLLPMPEQSNLVIPDVARDRSHIGRVVAVGPGLRDHHGKLHPVTVRPNDVIWFSLNDHEDGDYTLIRQGDVFGLVDAC